MSRTSPTDLNYLIEIQRSIVQCAPLFTTPLVDYSVISHTNKCSYSTQQSWVRFSTSIITFWYLFIYLFTIALTTAT